jgi:DNA-binding Lrp family transcriptional regulator
MPNYKEITRLYLMGISRNEISRRVKSSKNTVSRVIKALNEHGYKNGCDVSVSEDELNRMFEMPASVQSVPDVMYAMPDYSSLVNELKKPGVTMKLLWDEYCYDCRKTDQIPYRLTQFKHYFHENLLKTGFTDIIHHKPGEETEGDWAGSQPT